MIVPTASRDQNVTAAEPERVDLWPVHMDRDGLATMRESARAVRHLIGRSREIIEQSAAALLLLDRIMAELVSAPHPECESGKPHNSDVPIDEVLADVDQLIIDGLVSTKLVKARSKAMRQSIDRSHEAIEQSRALLVEVSVRQALGRPYIGRLWPMCRHRRSEP